MSGDDEAPGELLPATRGEPDPPGLDLPPIQALGYGIPEAAEAPAAQQRGAIVLSPDAQRLGQAPGTRGQQPIVGDAGPPAAHGVEAQEGLARPQQHRLADSRRRAYDVGAPVHAVTEVHVEAPGRPIHGAGARSRPSISMRAGIESAPIRLGLDYSQRYPALGVMAEEDAADQVAGDRERVARVEGAREPARRGLQRALRQAATPRAPFGCASGSRLDPRRLTGVRPAARR